MTRLIASVAAACAALSLLASSPAVAQQCACPTPSSLPPRCSASTPVLTTCQYQSACSFTPSCDGDAVISTSSCNVIEQQDLCQRSCATLRSCTACEAGFYGPNCDPCPSCNGGTCNDGIGGNGSCSSCPAGQAGPFCQYSNAATCNGHGAALFDGSCACLAGFAGASCNQCASGYFGFPTCTFCQASSTCNGHGSCSSTGGCICAAGFTGANCQSCAPGFFGPNCTSCDAATTCSGEGSCSSTGSCICNAHHGGSSCNVCDPGYFGSACQACPGGASTPCSNHGVCNSGFTGNGTCTCNVGFFGADCSTSTVVVSLVGDDTQAASPGTSATFTVHVSQGLPPFQLAVTGLPSGVTGTFSPSPLGADGDSTLTLSVGASVRGQIVDLVIEASDSEGTSHANATLAIVEDCTPLSAQVAQLTASLGTANAQLAACTADDAAQAQANAVLTAQLVQAQTDLATCNAHAAALAAQLTQCLADGQTLQAELGLCTAQTLADATQIAQLTSEAAQLAAQLAAAQQQLAQTQQQLNQCTAGAAALQAQVAAQAALISDFVSSLLSGDATADVVAALHDRVAAELAQALANAGPRDRHVKSAQKQIADGEADAAHGQLDEALSDYKAAHRELLPLLR